MDFLQTLRAHTGGLIRIKSELFWYGGRGWDGAPGRACLLLDAASPDDAAPTALRCRDGLYRADDARVRAVLLLIDGCPHWVWVAQEDVEIL